MNVSVPRGWRCCGWRWADGVAGNGGVPAVDGEGAGAAETEEGCEVPARGGALGKGGEDAGSARHGGAGAGDGGKPSGVPWNSNPSTKRLPGTGTLNDPS